MFRKVETRHDYDIYETTYVDRIYTIIYNPTRNRIEQIRPLSDGSTDTVVRLFNKFIENTNT
ncbi:hypothetical protein [Salsuginibacillus kocurii]|uniref:hypothetical protein n=1 Tax=Salsuginibacillus kocurii TaxID=427078 RepID=UPI000364EAFB|nr:hypothetical protein [Salsuginibacillus kocurii]